MQQLVGLACVHCSRTIGSIIDGCFCPTCGCPMHTKCMRPAHSYSPDVCSECGTKEDVIKRVSAQRTKDDKQAQLPISAVGIHGAYESFQLLRFILAGLVCGFGGLGLLVWEFSEPEPSLWAIGRSILLAILGFGLVATLTWVGTRSHDNH